MGKPYNYVRGDLEERFWSKVDKKADEECWNWLASLDTKGYGNFSIPHETILGRFITKRAHRICWELSNKEKLTPDKYLCHKCDNPKCVNPSHIFVGTAKDNIQDCIEKGRLPDRKGNLNSRSKLTEEDVRLCREQKLSAKQVMEIYGVSNTTAHYMLKGITWSHI